MAPQAPDAGEAAHGGPLCQFLATLAWDVTILVSLREVLWLQPGRQAVDDVAFVRSIEPAWDAVLEGLPALLKAVRGAEDAASTRRRTALHASGLTGAELDAKLAAWRAARARALPCFHESLDPGDRYPWIARIMFGGAAGGADEAKAVVAALALIGRTLSDEYRPEGFPAKEPMDKERALRAVTGMLDHAGTITKSLIKAVPGGEALSEAVDLIMKVSGQVASHLVSRTS